MWCDLQPSIVDQTDVACRVCAQDELVVLRPLVGHGAVLSLRLLRRSLIQLTLNVRPVIGNVSVPLV